MLANIIKQKMLLYRQQIGFIKNIRDFVLSENRPLNSIELSLPSIPNELISAIDIDQYKGIKITAHFTFELLEPNPTKPNPTQSDSVTHESQKLTNLQHKNNDVKLITPLTPKHLEQASFLHVFKELLISYFRRSVKQRQRVSKIHFLTSYCFEKGYEMKYSSFRNSDNFNQLWSSLMPTYRTLIQNPEAPI